MAPSTNPSSLPPPSIATPLTTLLGIKYPILLAGMAHTSTAALASAVSNAGGLGTIGGLGYTPTQLRTMIHELKSLLTLPYLPFGVDLALPAVGGTARKTNHDYTHGQLDSLIDVIIDEGATLFVSAVGVPPVAVVERLHGAGIVVMNMVGHPKHAKKAFAAGVDVVCAQGGEGGGHTGDIPMHLLVPACVDEARKWKPPLIQSRLQHQNQNQDRKRSSHTTGAGAGAEIQIGGLVVAAGGIVDGRGLAASLAMGAVGVWIGTRFVASHEAGCSTAHKDAVVSAGWEDTVKTLVVSGRPLRVRRNAYLDDWHLRRGDEMERLTQVEGKVPMVVDLEREEDVEEEEAGAGRGKAVEVDMPFLMGQVAALVGDVKPAGQIVEDMVREAVEMLRHGAGYTIGTATGGGREYKL